MYGNNIQCSKIQRIVIPFFSDSNGFANPGTKYFFPENPQIDRNEIVGIEAHANIGAGLGDLSRPLPQQLGTTATDLRNILFTFVDAESNEIFENVPALFLFGRFTFTGSPKQKINPFTGKIKTKSCYAYIPANSGITLKDIYITISFYLK